MGLDREGAPKSLRMWGLSRSGRAWRRGLLGEIPQRRGRCRSTGRLWMDRRAPARGEWRRNRFVWRGGEMRLTRLGMRFGAGGIGFVWGRGGERRGLGLRGYGGRWSAGRSGDWPGSVCRWAQSVLSTQGEHAQIGPRLVEFDRLLQEWEIDRGWGGYRDPDSRSRTNASATLRFFKDSAGSWPILRSSRAAGREPSPWTLATESRSRNGKRGSGTSYRLGLRWVVRGTYSTSARGGSGS